MKKNTDDTKRLSRSDWLLTARDSLIKRGIDGVKVDQLAKTLNVTRGSFYWHFKGRPDLLTALLAHWRATNNRPMITAIETAAIRGRREDFATVLGEFWMNDTAYSPDYDSAIRQWARSESRVEQAVREVDDERIEAFRKMFEAYGYEGDRAFVRARVTYFHQVGYYALSITESHDMRERLGPLYDEILLE